MTNNFFDKLNLDVKLTEKLKLKIASNTNNNEYKVELIAEQKLSPDEFYKLWLAIENFNFKEQIKISLFDSKIIYPKKSIPIDYELYSYLTYLLLILVKDSSRIELSKFFIEVYDKEVMFFVRTNDTLANFLKLEKKIFFVLTNLLGIEINSLDFKFNKEKFEIGSHSHINIENLEKIRNYETQKISSLNNYSNNSSFTKSKASQKITTANRYTEIKDANFEGEVFKIELNDREKMKFIKLWLKGEEFSIVGKIFYKIGQKFDNFKIKDYLLVKGSHKFNSWSKMYELNINQFIIAKKKSKTNNEVMETRSELHIHSQMSQLDGVGKVEDYFQKASESNINAIAFTDHNVVQSFPEIYKFSKKYQNVKPIYGVEFDIFDDIFTFELVKNSKNLNLNDATYVFLDLETTSLFSIVGEIIEFGGIKIKNNNIVDELEMLIKPAKPISKATTKLTNITNEDLAKCLNIKEVVTQIRNFIKDCIIVAHNANFDISFLNKVFADNNLEKIYEPIIDTLKISWLVNKKIKNHKLGTVAREYNIIYDEMIAHRALYDSKILYQIFEHMLFKLFERKINNLDDINKFKDEVRDNFFPFHIILLAKNQLGIKSLYKLISDSHTIEFNKIRKIPWIPLSKIIENRKDLIIGSACAKGLVWDSIVNSYDNKEIERVYNIFDYIEISHPEVYSNFVNSERMSKDEILITIKKIVEYGEKFSKKIVLTSNAHYVFKDDKIARDVYIANKGIGGIFHPLYNFANPHQENPNQHLRNASEFFDSKLTTIFSNEEIRKMVTKNSLAISELVENNIIPISEKLHFPTMDNINEKFLEELEKGKLKWYGNTPHKIINERISKELEAIQTHKYTIIYYLCSKIVKKSLEDGFLVGSRGSVGSSLVANLLEITEVNPLPPHYICYGCKYHEFYEQNDIDDGYDLPTKKCPICKNLLKGEGHNIPFETFLGFDGEKVPDIDLNFSGTQQSNVHNFVKTLLGKNSVFRAGTISTVQEKTAYGFVRNYLELKGTNIENYDKADFDFITCKVEGTKRTSGQHPGAIIVIPNNTNINDFTPVNFPGNDIDIFIDSNLENNWLTTHFDFHTLHDTLLKLDLLGHDDPSMLKELKESSGIDPKEINFNDKKVLALFSNIDVLDYQVKKENIKSSYGVIGIPEFGTTTTRRILTEVIPQTFADLIRISGLSHGTNVWTNNAQELIKNKIAKLNEVISIRDEIMNFLISKGIENKIAFEITEGVRKGNGVKESNIEIMKKFSVPNWYIESCKKIRYLFPKAHATAYVMAAYRIAWYKIYYPLQYYCAYFSIRENIAFDIDLFDNHEKVKTYLDDWKFQKKEKTKAKDIKIFETFEIINELFNRGFKIFPISLEKSNTKNWQFDLSKKALIPPFNIIDGLGEAIANKIIEERNIRKFDSLKDFENRVALNKTLLLKFKELGILKTLPLENDFQMKFEI